LDRNAVARANAGNGLNLVTLHHGWAETTADGARRLTDDKLRTIREKKTESFIAFHAGYNIRSMMAETTDATDVTRIQGVGVRLLTDFADYWAEHPHGPCPPGGKSFLVGLTREEAGEGCRVRPVFQKPDQPRFCFSASQRAVLFLALHFWADEEIANDLETTLSAVHNRKAMYERVTKVDEYFFADGKEKKVQLLSYLRDHPEELRPFAGP
jgi:hypothetical protein